MITVHGKALGIKFNNYAIEQIGYVKNSGFGLFQYVTAVVWGGYCGYCFAKQVDAELTFEEVSDWVDGATDNEQVEADVKAIQNAFYESQAFVKLMKKAAETQPVEKKSEELSGATFTSTPGEKLD